MGEIIHGLDLSNDIVEKNLEILMEELGIDEADIDGEFEG